MGFLDEISDAAKRGTASVGRTGKTAQINMKIRELNNQRGDLMRQLGESLFDEVKDKEEFRAGREVLLDGITSLNQQVEDLKAQISSMEAEAEEERQALEARRAAEAEARAAAAQAGPQVVPMNVAAGIVCASCGSPIPAGDKFCMACGAPAPVAAAPIAQPINAAPAPGAATICSTCGAPLGPADKFCMACGAPNPNMVVANPTPNVVPTAPEAPLASEVVSNQVSAPISDAEVEAAPIPPAIVEEAIETSPGEETPADGIFESTETAAESNQMDNTETSGDMPAEDSEMLEENTD